MVHADQDLCKRLGNMMMIDANWQTDFAFEQCRWR
jgi:hypothetical protein